MQANKRIGMIPMPAWAFVFVDKGKGEVGFFYQDIGKGHAHSSASYNKIVC